MREKARDVRVLMVIGEKIANANNEYFVVRDPDNDKTYEIRKYPFQFGKALPSVCSCLLHTDDEGNVVCEQDKYSLYRQLYKEGNEYDFKLIAKESDQHSHSEYLLVIDKYGFTNRIYQNEHSVSFDKFEIGQDLKCYLQYIGFKGFLSLSFCDRESTVGLFISAEYLFGRLSLSDAIDEFFFQLRPLVEAEEYKQKQFYTLFVEYEHKENLWIFSYLSFLKTYLIRQIEQFPYETMQIKLEKMINIYISIENWLLEDSDFGSNFRREKRLSIFQAAESNMARMQVLLDTVQLVKKEEEENYIMDLLQKVIRTRYLKNKELHWQRINWIMLISPRLSLPLLNYLGHLAFLLITEELLDEVEINRFVSRLENLFRKYRRKTDKLKEQIFLSSVLSLLYYRLKKNEEYFLQKITLIKLLSIYQGTSSQQTTFLALLELAGTDIPPWFGWEDVINGKLLDREIKLSILSDISTACQIWIMEQNLVCLYKDTKFYFLLGRQAALFQQYDYVDVDSFYSICQERINVGSVEGKKLDVKAGIMEISNKWNSLLGLNAAQERPSLKAGAMVTFTVNRNKNSVSLISKTFSGFHGPFSHECFSRWISPELATIDLSLLLPTGIELSLPILEVENKVVRIDFIGFIWNITKQMVHEGDVLLARLVSCNKHYAYWITDEGFSCLMSLKEVDASLSPFLSLANSRVHQVRVTSLSDKVKALWVDWLGVSLKETFSLEDAFHVLFEKYVLPASHSEKQIKEPLLQRTIEWKMLFLSIFDNEIEHTEDLIQKYNLLQIGKMIASILKSNKSYYYVANLTYLYNVKKFQEKSEDASTGYSMRGVGEITLRDFPDLQEKKEMICLLNYYKTLNPEDNFTLSQICFYEKSERIRILAELILQVNLMFRNHMGLSMCMDVKRRIIAVLLNKNVEDMAFDQSVAEENKVENGEVSLGSKKILSIDGFLGNEDEKREFKSSAFFSPEGNNDVSKTQMGRILSTIAGFLNSQGGSLFIGVGNDGYVRGLRSDFTYIQGGADLYERLIRQNIVREFSKDINSLITFKFYKYRTETYCEIIIPPFNLPVNYKSCFWQRQGNETRVLKGRDLQAFVCRRFPDIPRENVNVDARFASSYLLFNQDGSFVLVDKMPENEEVVYRALLPITDANKDGFLLIGYENGRINKIPLQLLRDKSQDETYKDGFNPMNLPILLMIIPKHMLLAIYSKRFDKEFIKVLDTANIPSRKKLSLKGYRVIGEGEVFMYKVIEQKHRSALESVIYYSPQPMGVNLENPDIQEELRYLETAD